MVATRRSKNLDVIEQTPSNIENVLLPRRKSNKSKNASSSTAISCKSTAVDNGPKEHDPIRHSVRLRKESPSPPASSRPSRNASRSLDSDFEWGSQPLPMHRSIGKNYKTRELNAIVPRRSSRHQPSHYVGLEEDYIQCNSSDIEVQYDRTANNIEGTNQSQGTEEKGERKKREPSDLLAVQGKKLYMEPDIYSSVKSRVRVSTRDKLYQEYFTQGTSKEKQHEGEESQSEETGEEEDEDDGEHTNEEEEEEDEEEGHPYKLRKIREAPKRYMIVREVQRRRPRSLFEDLPCSPARRRRRRPPGTPAQTPYLKRRRRARTQGNSSTSSDSSSSDDEIKFRTRQQKSMSRARNECLPINLSSADLSKHSFARERKKIGQSLADIDPMGLDTSVTFSSVGGHNKHIRALKEMVVFPLLYPEVFEKFSITPPRGCLFYGPPGTGKTLMARALANECSTDGKKVSFFMKKGADCLSKWIGESERQLRVLFDQAYQMRPSIIFFDEIDGLAPVRSSRQDQIHSSIVSTLLALMDGLDSRGEVIVIGATNRIDSIDPALRRPGRFDREFLFPLPDKQAREAILQIHTKAWNPQLKPSYIEYLAAKTVGYCGADLKALCTEAALTALRRRYPQIYESREKLQLNIDTISIQAPDFHIAVKNIIPTAQRSASNPGRALSCTVKPLLGSYLQQVVLQLSKLFPVIKRNSKVICAQQTETEISNHIHIEHDYEVGGHSEGIYVGDTIPENRANPIFSILSGNSNGVVQSQYSTLLSKLSSVEQSLTAVHRPRFIVCGDSSSGSANHLAPALLHDMEGIPVHCLDLPALYGISVRTPEESCAQVFREARRAMPSVIYLPNALGWWTVASATLQATLEALLQDIPPNAPILFLAATDCTYLHLPHEFAKFFHSDFHEVYETEVKFYAEQRREFFAPIFLIHAITPPPRNQFANSALEALSKAPIPEPAPLTEEEENRLEKEEESTLRNLRLFLRGVLMRLERDRRFKIFSKPVDFEEVPDYIEVIKNPMDFSTAQTKIDQHKYQTVGMFLDDIDLICNNALEYNPDRRPEDKLIRHRACCMRDMAHAIADTDLEPEFEKLCQEVVESRKRRGVSMNKSAPKFYPVLPKHLRVHPITNEITPKPDSQPLTDSNPTAQTEQQAEKIQRKQRKRHHSASKPKSHHSASKPKRHHSASKPKRHHSASKPKIKPSTWSRGIIVASAKKKKKVVHVVEFNEDDKAEEDLAKDEDVEDESHQESEVEMTNDEDFHKNDEEEEVIEIPTSPPQDEQIHTGKEDLRVSFGNGTEMEINIDQDSKDSTSRPEQNMAKTDEDSHALSNGYGLDDILQDEMEACCAVSPEGVEEISSLGKAADGEDEGEEEETNSQSPDFDADVTEVQESQEDEPSAPKRMTLRSRKPSTSESSRISNSEDVEKPPCPPPPPFIVDHKKLLKLLEDVVSLTESYTLDELERAHASLSRCMGKYRMEYDRTALTEDFEKEIQSFSSLMGTKASNHQHNF